MDEHDRDYDNEGVNALKRGWYLILYSTGPVFLTHDRIHSLMTIVVRRCGRLQRSGGRVG